MDEYKLYCKLGKILDERNITAYKLAKDINERIGTIYKLVNNKDMESSRLPVNLIVKICVYFDITLDALFEIVKIE
jgi:predicted transcriptional regulator